MVPLDLQKVSGFGHNSPATPPGPDRLREVAVLGAQSLAAHERPRNQAFRDATDANGPPCHRGDQVVRSSQGRPPMRKPPRQRLPAYLAVKVISALGPTLAWLFCAR